MSLDHKFLSEQEAIVLRVHQVLVDICKSEQVPVPTMQAALISFMAYMVIMDGDKSIEHQNREIDFIGYAIKRSLQENGYRDDIDSHIPG